MVCLEYFKAIYFMVVITSWFYISCALAWPNLRKTAQGAEILHFSKTKFTHKTGGLLGPFDTFDYTMI